MTAVCIKNFFFLSFTLPLPAPACVRVRPPVNMVKEGKKSGCHGSSRVDRPGYARGNSRGIRLTYFNLSESRLGARPWGPTLPHVAFRRPGLGNGHNGGNAPHTRQRRGPRMARWKHTRKEHRMKLEQWDIERVTPYERNPRRNLSVALDRVSTWRFPTISRRRIINASLVIQRRSLPRHRSSASSRAQTRCR